MSQVLALQSLEENMSISVHELASLLHLECSTVSRLVDGLVKYGYVRRETTPDNRREVQLFLTDQGERAINKVRGQSVGFLRKVIGSLPDKHFYKIVEGFQGLTQALEKCKE